MTRDSETITLTLPSGVEPKDVVRIEDVRGKRVLYRVVHKKDEFTFVVTPAPSHMRLWHWVKERFAR